MKIRNLCYIDSFRETKVTFTLIEKTFKEVPVNYLKNYINKLKEIADAYSRCLISLNRTVVPMVVMILLTIQGNVWLAIRSPHSVHLPDSLRQNQHITMTVVSLTYCQVIRLQ